MRNSNHGGDIGNEEVESQACGKSSDGIIKSSHQYILDPDKAGSLGVSALRSLLLAAPWLSLSSCVCGSPVKRRKWGKEASELHVWCMYVFNQARTWKGLSFKSRKHQ